MIPENGIKNRWDLLCKIIKNNNIQHEFSAYGWYQDANLRISKDEHWFGWWNDKFEFVSMWARSEKGKALLNEIVKVFTENGYLINKIINNGISIEYHTMTQDEVHEKARRNLLAGGRMSD